MKETHPVEHPLHEDRVKRAQEIQKKGGWYCYCPDEWLKGPEWSVLTAMLLFAGLNPKRVAITWDTHGKCADVRHIERIGWEYSNDGGYALWSREEFEKELIRIRKEAEENLNECRQLNSRHGGHWTDFSLKDCRDNERHENCNKWLAYYEESERLLNYFIESWLETKGLHYNEFDQPVRSEKMPVSFFLQWAVENDLIKYIPWWDEAIQDGVVDLTSISEQQRLKVTEGKSFEAEQTVKVVDFNTTSNQIDLDKIIDQKLQKAIPLAEMGGKFKAGRKPGSPCPFTTLMLDVYKDCLNSKAEIAARELWDKIPKGVDEKTGIIVQDKISKEIDEPVIDWRHPNGTEKTLTFKNFRNRFTKIKKLAAEIPD